VWRTKAQFDAGTGIADVLPDLVARLTSAFDDGGYTLEHACDALRSPEECVYHQLLVDAVPSPSSVLSNVGRWTD
jgi:hypothetical protein